jgi:serine/threonine protein kinase
VNPEIERLFDEALELPHAQRADFLVRNCPDLTLRREVELLLEHDEGAETFLDHSLSSAAAAMFQSLAMPPGQQIGAYRILSAVGRGGMGVVYLAERADRKFDQRVAIKVVAGGPDIPLVVKRLQQEYQILARLEHPNIARLLDAGATAEGLPYFVMEYVDGQAIDKFCEEHKLSVRARLRLFLPVCDAVQFAHQRLIVHRDLKPDNILVNENGIPKLLDFGIAKVLGEGQTGTQTTVRAMTPEYASPEQIRGEPVGTAADVYSSGGVLYKLLTGEHPHQLQGKSASESIRIICEQEVRKPSELRRELAGDLDHILQMALRKEPLRRYRSMEQLAADIGRLLEGSPVLASPDTIWYRSSKFVRRHWLGVAAAIIVIIALGTGAGIANWQARRAERRFADVRHLANAFLFDFEQSIHNVPGTTKARQLLVKTALEYLQNLSREASGDPVLARELAAAYEKVGDIQGDPNGGNVGNVAGAVRSYNEAISLRRSLGDPKSHNPKIRSDFTKVLMKLVAVEQRTDNLDAAIQNCGEALGLSDVSHRTEPDDPLATEGLARAYMELAKLQQRRSETDPALENARRGVELWQSLVAGFPHDRSRQEGLAYAYWRWAELYARLYRSREALPLYEKALRIYEGLSSDDPANAGLRRQLMIVLVSLNRERWGAAGRDRGKPPSAEVVIGLRKAYGIADQAVIADPANAEAVSDLTAISAMLGSALEASGDRRGAQGLLKEAVESASNLVERDPGSRENRLNLAICQVWLATHLSKNGDVAGALRYREIAAATYANLVASSANDAKILESQVANWGEIGKLRARRGEWATAHQNYTSALHVTEAMLARNPAFNEYLDELRQADQRAILRMSQQK